MKKYINENEELGSFRDYVKSNRHFIDPETGIINTELVERAIKTKYAELERHFGSRQWFEYWLKDYISLLDEVANNEHYTKERLNNKDVFWWKLDTNGWIEEFKNNVDSEPHGDTFTPDEE